MQNEAYEKYQRTLSVYQSALESGRSQDELKELEEAWWLAYFAYLWSKGQKNAHSTKSVQTGQSFKLDSEKPELAITTL